MFNKIFNIGLPKTGTSSLHKALLDLDFKSKHFPQFRQQTQEGCYCFDDDDWQALTNFGEHFYPQLDQEYPNSKFILTLRNEEQWLESWKRQIGKGTGSSRYDVTDLSWGSLLRKRLERMKEALFDDMALPRLDLMRTRIEIFGMYKFHAGRCQYVYRLHHRNVLEYFKDRPDDLLVMDICGGDGWEKLCPFLEVSEIPGTFFPHKSPSPSPGA